ncbi:MAG: hypothetical protein ABSE63_11580 [Thermoguttaceae bacterium]|jgi:hypothetical protein
MTDRERWIVYPLVFLTLGIALRNQFLPTRQFGAVDLRAGEISAQKIICNDLEVRQTGACNQLQCEQFKFDEALGKHIRTLGLTESVLLKAGEAEFVKMLIVNTQGKPVVLAGSDKNAQFGVIQTMASNGLPLVQLRATDTGGTVTAMELGGKVVVEMGQEGQNFGVFAKLPQGQIMPLTLPLRLEPQPLVPKPSQSPAPNTPEQKENPPSGGKTP